DRRGDLVRRGVRLLQGGHGREATGPARSMYRRCRRDGASVDHTYDRADHSGRSACRRWMTCRPVVNASYQPTAGTPLTLTRVDLPLRALANRPSRSGEVDAVRWPGSIA